MALLDALYNRPNHVIQNQKLFQSQIDRPLYWRGPRGPLYMRTFYAIFAVSMGYTAFGLFHLIKGKD